MNASWLFPLLLLLFTPAAANGAAGPEGNQVCEVINSPGWELPRFTRIVVETRTQPLPSPPSREYEGVYIRIFRPYRKLVTTIPLYRFQDSKLEVRNQAVIVKQVQEFRYVDKPYAYGIVYAWVSSSTGAELGAISEFMYVDSEGKGSFKLRKGCGPGFLPPPPGK